MPCGTCDGEKCQTTKPNETKHGASELCGVCYDTGYEFFHCGIAGACRQVCVLNTNECKVRCNLCDSKVIYGRREIQRGGYTYLNKMSFYQKLFPLRKNMFWLDGYIWELSLPPDRLVGCSPTLKSPEMKVWISYVLQFLNFCNN